MDIRIPRIAIALLAAVMLPACTAAALMGGSDADKYKPTLAEASYRAADMLSQQTQAVLGRETPLQIGAISDIASPAAAAPFGRTVASQLAARFVQLGYNVSASSYDEMSGGAPAALPMAPPSGAAYGAYGGPAPSSATLTGQYAVAKDDVLVNLRLLDTASNKVLAAYDYSMTMTGDIRELTAVPGAKKGFFDF
jgi:hypothetical protein